MILFARRVQQHHISCLPAACGERAGTRFRFIIMRMLVALASGARLDVCHVTVIRVTVGLVVLQYMHSTFCTIHIADTYRCRYSTRQSHAVVFDPPRIRRGALRLDLNE